MRNRVSIALIASLGLLFFMVPAAHADSTMVFGSNPYGVSGPYWISVDGTLMSLFCDDYVDHIGSGSTWSAAVISGSTGDLSTTQMASRNGWTTTQANTAYDAKAWLEINMTNANRDQYNYAIWEIFNHSLIGSLPDESALIATATTNGVGFHEFVTVYSPTAPISAGYNTGGTAQEFDRVPDGGMTLMFLGGVLVGLETLRRRFRA
jgi:hypothetical protein